MSKKRTVSIYPMTPVQCRAARAALDVTLRDVAAQAGVAYNTVLHFEQEHDTRPDSVERIQQALEALGARFGASDTHVVLTIPR